MPSSKQVMVSMSGQLLEMFDELMEELNFYTEAELFRVALKTYYKQQKGDKEEFHQFLRKEISQIVEKEIIKKS